MQSRAARTLLGLVALIIGASACEMRLELATKVNADGSGQFSVRVALDREFVEGLSSLERLVPGGSEISGMAVLEDFYSCLEAREWTVRRDRPDGGVVLAASRSFPDAAGFEAVLASMRCEGSGEIQISNFGLTVDFGSERSFLRTRSFFSGTVDLTFESALDEESRRLLSSVQDVARDFFVFEVAAEMPGPPTVKTGGGTVVGRRAVWEPRLGEQLNFSAESSSLNTTALLLILLPAAGIVGVALWVAAGRRRKPPASAILTPDGPAAGDG